jgi:hypothetical protein
LYEEKHKNIIINNANGEAVEKEEEGKNMKHGTL